MFKYNMKLWMGVLLVLVLAAAFAYVAFAQEQRLQTQEQSLQTQTQRLQTVEAKVSNMDILQLEVVDLQAKINSLSDAQANTAIPQTGANNTNQTANASKEQAVNPTDIALAQNVMDTAGFHVMAATLSQTKTIDPNYLATVTRVKKVLLATQWPAALADQEKSYVATLDSFATALQGNNADQAVNQVNNVHMGQHAFSSAIDKYLSSAANQTQGQAVSRTDIALAQNVMDSAGFHVMAATLSQTKTIDSAYLTTVNQVKKVLSATQWPAALTDQSKGFIGQLDTLAAALQANNPDQAVTAVNNVHMAQHAFSKAIDDWLSSPTAQ
jgi:type II secretory pathway pseudopilin PulG